jgi:hypothetical protein
LQYNGLMLFFALAIADKALRGFETLDDLMKARLPRDRDSWELEWKDKALELPVLRMASAKGVSESRALTYAALWNQIVSLGSRVGYRDAVKIHAIRAGVANKIVGELRPPQWLQSLLTMKRSGEAQTALGPPKHENI